MLLYACFKPAQPKRVQFKKVKSHIGNNGSSNEDYCYYIK